MSTLADLQFLKRTYQTQVGLVRNEARTKRETEYFKENVGKLTNAEDFLKDDRLYRYVMEAFGLESHIFAKGLIRKILKEGVVDEKSAANRMTDPKFKEMAGALGFAENQGANLRDPVFVAAIVKRLEVSRLEVAEGEKNPAIRLALYFERKAPQLRNWYQVLADRALSEVVLTSFGLPPEAARPDIDRLKASFEKRMDIKDLKDPQKLKRFIERFAVMHDSKAGGAMEQARNRFSALMEPLGTNRRIPVIGIDPSITLTLMKIPRF